MRHPVHETHVIESCTCKLANTFKSKVNILPISSLKKNLLDVTASGLSFQLTFSYIFQVGNWRPPLIRMRQAPVQRIVSLAYQYTCM